MTHEEIKTLYTRFVIPESRNAPYFTEGYASGDILAYNPMCGDKYRIDLRITDSVIRAAHFGGHGCALSKASTSAMLAQIVGKPVNEAQRTLREFIEHIEGRLDTIKGEEENLLSTLMALREFDGRQECITLSWKAVIKVLNND